MREHMLAVRASLLYVASPVSADAIAWRHTEPPLPSIGGVANLLLEESSLEAARLSKVAQASTGRRNTRIERGAYATCVREADALFAEFDIDGSDSISFREFEMVSSVLLYSSIALLAEASSLK